MRVTKKKVNNPLNKELIKLGKLVGKSLIMHKLSDRDFKIKTDNLAEVEAESGSEGEDSDDSAANSSR